MKPVEVHRKAVKKMNQSTPKFFNPPCPLSWPLRNVFVAECRRLLNAPECGLHPVLSSAGTFFFNSGNGSVPALLPRHKELHPQAPERFRFLRGLEETKRVSPLFRISLLKRLSCYSKAFEQTARKPLTGEPRTLHAHARPVVKRFLWRGSTIG